MRKLTTVFPCLPPPELNPNNLRRNHWSKRSSVSKTSREYAKWQSSADRNLQWSGYANPMEKVTINILFGIKGRREIDLDNLLSASKAWIDGIVDAGIMASDKRSCVRRITIEWESVEIEHTTFTINEIK